MFKSSDIDLDVTLDEILEHVSEYDIFKRYCTNFKEINKPFASDLYKDNNPDCRIFFNAHGHPIYKDFGESEHYFRCFDYLIYKYNLGFKECLKMIAKDFNIKGGVYMPKPPPIPNTEYKDLPSVKIVPKSVIYISKRSWSLHDYKYWAQFGICFNDLHGEVIPCHTAYLVKGEKTIVFNNTNANPIYAYREYDWETNKFIGYKIYMPLNPNKDLRFISCPNVSRSIPGWDKLPENGDLLIITKSRKDVICCRKAGYSSISLQAESNNLPSDVVDNINKRFKKIVVFYDNDDPGIKSADKIRANYGFKSIIIPKIHESKDMSELVSKKGEKYAKNVLNTLIDEMV